MKLAACPLVLAGILLGSSAVLVGARLGTENNNNAVDDESTAAKHDSQRRRRQLTPRRLDILDKMFSSMIEDAGRVMDQLDDYMPSSSTTMDKGDFDMSSMMDLMGDYDMDFAKPSSKKRFVERCYQSLKASTTLI